MFGIREDTQTYPKFLQAARQSYESGDRPLVDVRFRCEVSARGSSLTVTDPQGRS